MSKVSHALALRIGYVIIPAMRIMATLDLYDNFEAHVPKGIAVVVISPLDERHQIAYDPTWVEV